MARFIHFTDPDSPEMIRLLGEIPPCPGTCFFIDISRSTHIKYTSPVTTWGRQLNNTFNFISLLNDFPDNIVKGIGDELMLYIPDEILKGKTSVNSYFALLEEIYATLFNLKNHPATDLFLNCKVAIHYCTDAYNITFLKNVNDYYGSDIDLTARLMGKSVENRIVVSEVFYEKVIQDLMLLKKPVNSGCLEGVSGVKTEFFRGIPEPIEFRIIDI
jgi:class 3 adenylate cyclase